MARNILLFQSDAFSLKPPLNEAGVPYDRPLGDDICSFLKAGLESKQVAWTISDPSQEDFGAVLRLHHGKDVFTVTTSWQGDNEWALVIGQMRGCLGWLFDRKPDEQALKVMEEIRHLVDEVVSTDADRFKNPTWITDEEFPGVAQKFVIPE